MSSKSIISLVLFILGTVLIFIAGIFWVSDRFLFTIIGIVGLMILLIIEIQLIEVFDKKVDGEGTSKITVGKKAPKNPKNWQFVD